MFNFSANNLIWISTKSYDKCNVHIMKDIDTNRCYKAYDYSKDIIFKTGKTYFLYGKVNSADILYLIIEKCKEKLEIIKTYENKSMVE